MIVLDCSALVDIVRHASNGALLIERITTGEPIISSSLIHAELPSALRKYVRAGLMGKREALAKMELASTLIDTYAGIAQDRTEAFAESLRLDHSPYDMFYFILARHNAATLVTLDRALANLCKQEGVDCLGPDELAADNVLFMSNAPSEGDAPSPTDYPGLTQE